MTPPSSRPVAAWAWLLGSAVVGWWLLGVLPVGTVGTAVVVLYYALAGASFTFLYGSLGAMSLAQPVFLAVGGYTAIYLANAHGISPWLALVVAPLVAAVLAVPLGLVSVRIGRGVPMSALLTLCVAQAAIPVLAELPALGGAAGLFAHVVQDPGFWDMQFLSGVDFARLFLVLNAAVLAFLLLWRRTRLGYYVTALKDSPRASAAMGVPNVRMYVAVFAIAAALAAPAGVVFAQYNLIATPTLFLGPGSLFQVALVGLVGGTARVWGPLAGAVTVVWLPSYIAGLSPGIAGLSQLTFAAVFVAIALFLPRGISGTWAQLTDERRRSPAPAGQVLGSVRDATKEPADGARP